MDAASEYKDRAGTGYTSFFFTLTRAGPGHNKNEGHGRIRELWKHMGTTGICTSLAFCGIGAIHDFCLFLLVLVRFLAFLDPGVFRHGLGAEYVLLYIYKTYRSMIQPCLQDLLE